MAHLKLSATDVDFNSDVGLEEEPKARANIRPPCFQYQEVFESNDIYRGTSTGGGIFQDTDPDLDVTAGLQSIAFSVEKSRPNQQISVRIQSPTLRILLSKALRPAEWNGLNAIDHVLTLDLPTLLQKYTVLRSYLETEESKRRRNWSLLELRLLVCDFLLDRTVFVGFDLDDLYNQGFLSYAHWNDMQQWSLETDLDDLDRVLNVSVDSAASVRWRGLFRTLFEGQSTEVLESPFTLAIKRGDIRSVQALLDDTQDLVNALDLSTSLAVDRLDIFWMLLAHGAELEDSDLFLRAADPQPLEVAAKRGHLQAVEALLKRGANAGNTIPLALTAAAAGGRVDVVRYLLRLCPEDDGTTLHDFINDDNSLSAAVEHGHLEIVLLLLDQARRQPNGLARYSVTKSMLELAIEHGHVEIAQFLHQRLLTPGNGQIWSTSSELFDREYPETFLAAAARRGHAQMMRWLMHMNAPLRTDEHDSVFQALLRTGNYDLLQQVLNIVPKHDINAPIDQRRWDLAYRHKSPHLPVLDPPRVEEALVESLQDNHLNFLLKSRLPQATTAFRKFGDSLSDYRNISREGMATIRSITKNRLPTSLKQIVCCLELARAIRSCGKTIESCNTTGLDVRSETFCTEDEFVADLNRWRIYVPDNQKPLFDEIASIVWDKPFSPEDISIQYNPEEDLLCFTQLLCPLVKIFSTTTQRLNNSIFGGRRLGAIHQQYSQMGSHHGTQSDQNEPAWLSQKDGEPKDWNEERSRRIPLGVTKELSRLLVHLLSGPVFTILIGFLLLWRFGAAALLTVSTTTTASGTLRDSAQILKTSCIYLTLYLSLKWPWASATTSGSLSRSLPLGNLPTTMAPTLWPDFRQRDKTTQNQRMYDPNYSPREGSFGIENFEMEFQATSFNSESSPSASGMHHTDAPSLRSGAQTPAGNPSIMIGASSPDDRASDSSESLQRRLSPQPGGGVRCPGCREMFSTSSNRNRHFKHKCPHGPQKRVSCRNNGCDYVARIDNRNRHEKDSCSFRPQLQEGME